MQRVVEEKLVGFAPRASSMKRIRPGRSQLGPAIHNDTRSCLASLSKPITATAIMMLAERRRLMYDDPLSTYLAGFTDEVSAVTIRHLLTHTSGIPDDDWQNIGHPGVTNDDILAFVRNVQLPRFLEDHVFKPLEMQSTFVLTSLDQKTTDVARGYDASGAIEDFRGMNIGDNGVYSTVNDLLRFDQALYTDSLVSQRTLAEAFTPAHVREGRATYGFGWNIVADTAGTSVWHQGNTAGFRVFIERRLAKRISVIMLTNGGDTDHMAINNRVQRILQRET